MSYSKSKRREKLLALVNERGAISVGALAELLDVSMQTIRRDVDELCDGESLRRLHGRVELGEKALNIPFDQRTGTNLAAKESIGAAAAKLIPDGATIFISIGSTPAAVARALRARKGLTVITNNLTAAMALSDELSNRIIIPGGELRLPDRDLLGDEVVSFFARYRAEFGIFGTAGVASDGRLLEFHSAEVRASERIRLNSKTSILVIDRSKFGRAAPALGPKITDIDRVVVDEMPAEDFAEVIDSLGEKIVLAKENGS